MKTRATVSKFLKNLVVLSAIGVMAVSCGGKNTSGKSKNSTSNGNGTGIYNYPGYGNTYGNMTLEQMMPIIAQENPCAQGGQRVYMQVPLQGINVNVGSVYLGVSPFGDIAVIRNAGQAAMDLYACPRAAMSNQAQIVNYYPILETSQYCPVGQITAADVIVGGQQTQYGIKFAPIHIPGTDQLSQLCNSQGYY